MPILIDIENDYLYKLGYQKQNHLLLEAKEALKKMKAEAKAEAKKAEKEKLAEIAKARAEAEKLAIEKAEEIAKAKAEKLAIERAAEIAKAEVEKTKLLRLQTKHAIIKMKKANLEDTSIMDFLNLELETFNSFLIEIEEELDK
jgi:colicin import membrane protein